MAMGVDSIKEEQNGARKEYDHRLSETESQSRSSLARNEDLLWDEDDAAVILEELSINFGLNSTTTPRSAGSSAALMSLMTKAGSRKSTTQSPRSLLRSCLTQVLSEASLKAAKRPGQIGRLLSAKRNHIHNLSNDILCLQKKIKELEEQNRVLLRLTKRQESALKKFYNEETQLPHLLEAHRMEINVLQYKLKKATELSKSESDKVKKYDSRFLKMNDEIYQLKRLTTKKELPERETLHKKVTLTQSQLQDAQKESTELKRQSLILNKSYQQQLKNEITKHRATARRLNSLQEDYERALQKLGDREKQLAAVQQYRSRSNRALSTASSLCSSRNTYTALTLPGTVTTSSTTTAMRKPVRKRTACRKLTHITTTTFSASSQSEDGLESSCPYDVGFGIHNRETSAIDNQKLCLMDKKEVCVSHPESRHQSANAVGLDAWAMNCKLHGFNILEREQISKKKDDFDRKCSSDSCSCSRTEKLSSASLAQFSSSTLSSPDELGLLAKQDDIPSPLQLLQDETPEDSASRKNSILALCDDEVSRSASSSSSKVSLPTITPQVKSNCCKNNLPDTNQVNNSTERDAVELRCNRKPNEIKQIAKNSFDDSIYNDDVTTLDTTDADEEKLNISLIESYPPKERRKLIKENESTVQNSDATSCQTFASPTEAYDSPLNETLTDLNNDEVITFSSSSKNSITSTHQLSPSATNTCRFMSAPDTKGQNTTLEELK